MASREKGKTSGSERIERDVRAVTAEEPGQRAGTKPAKDLEKLLPETQRRGGLHAKGRATFGLGAKPRLSTIEATNGGRPHGGDRRHPVREAPVAGVRRRIEHVGQTGPQVASDQPAKDLQEKVLEALVLGLGEGVAPSGEGSDCAMGSSV